MKKYEQDTANALYEAILTLRTPDECRRFFEDLCTIGELSAMAQRLQVAKYLDQSLVYADIVEETGASTATISRVNRALEYGKDGYRLVLDRLKENAPKEA